MTITVESPSPAVLRNLQALLERAGYVLGGTALRLIHTADGLHLVHGTTTQPIDCPITPQALLAAIAQQLDVSPRDSHTLRHGWVFDPAQRVLTRQTTTCPLTEKEAMLLSMLLAASPDACPREALLKHIWAYEADIETHTLETHIYRLRQKLEALDPRPCDIHTVDGAYRLVYA